MHLFAFVHTFVCLAIVAVKTLQIGITETECRLHGSIHHRGTCLSATDGSEEFVARQGQNLCMKPTTICHQKESYQTGDCADVGQRHLLIHLYLAWSPLDCHVYVCDA